MIGRLVSVVSLGFVSIGLVTLGGAGGCGGLVDQVETENTYSTDAAVTPVTPPASGEQAIGSACSSDAMCRGTDPSSRLTCLEIHSGIPLPSGYCTEVCSADADCASGSFCAISPYDLGQPSYCQTTCATTSDCRTSDTCLEEEDISEMPASGCWTVPAR